MSSNFKQTGNLWFVKRVFRNWKIRESSIGSIPKVNGAIYNAPQLMLLILAICFPDIQIKIV